MKIRLIQIPSVFRMTFVLLLFFGMFFVQPVAAAESPIKHRPAGHRATVGR